MTRFIYINAEYDKQREQVISNVCTIARTILSLPNTIEIEIKNLDKSVYAETLATTRFPNRMRINGILNLTEVVKPLVHELIHLEQVFTGRLSINRQGYYIWNNKTYKNINPLNMSYKEYNELPWEMDVNQRLDKVLEYIINFGQT